MLATVNRRAPAAEPVPEELGRWAPVFADLDSALAGPGSAVATLAGAPGVGKSVAARAWSTVRGLDVISVSLANASSEADLVRSVLVELSAGQAAPFGPTDPLEIVLARRDELIVFDDADHVVEPLAALIRAVLSVRGACGLRLLVTSREPLRLHGERVIPIVRPSQAAAVELFLTACRAAGANVRGTAAERDDAHAIVALMDRVPLALEIAASHTRVVPLAALRRSLEAGSWAPRAGLRGGSPHHVSLDDAVMWSVGMLAEPERAVLDELCAFEGGFDLAAFDDIVGLHREDALASLVQKSLVRRFRAGAHADERFELPRIVREVVSRAGGPSPATRERHTAWYRRLGRVLAADGRTKRDSDRLLADYHNVAAARRQNCQRCPAYEGCECAASADVAVDTAILACPRVSPGGSCGCAADDAAAPSCLVGGSGANPTCPVIARVSRIAAEIQATTRRAGCELESDTSERPTPPWEESPGSRRLSRGAAAGTEVSSCLLSTAQERRLEVAPGGTHFRTPDGQDVDLSTRPTLARLLEQLVEARLAEPGAPVDAARLLERIWGHQPGRHPRANVGRLYIAIARLRALGLEQDLFNVGGGYLLNGAVPVVWSASRPGNARTSPSQRHGSVVRPSNREGDPRRADHERIAPGLARETPRFPQRDTAT